MRDSAMHAITDVTTILDLQQGHTSALTVDKSTTLLWNHCTHRAASKS